MSDLRVVFMGSDEIACPMLAGMLRTSGIACAAVVTQPPRPQGRHLQVTPCEVGADAARHGLRVLTPERVNTPAFIEELAALEPDVIVVVAYGQFLGRRLLALPPLGCINVHASLLPRYRGAAPIQWAIARGESETGVTTMLMAEKMDAGPILEQVTVPIPPDDTAATLQTRLAAAGAELLPRTLLGWRGGKLTPRPQVEADATFAPKLRKADGEIDWTLPAATLYNQVRGFNPWPGCTCAMPGESRPGPTEGAGRLKVHRVRVESATGKPGAVLDVSGDGPLIAAGEGAVRLLLVQPPGGKRMNGAAFQRGRPLRLGDRLGK